MPLDPNTAITLNGGNSSFAQNQQGAVDWVQLASMPISASMDIFVRLLAADIDPQTLGVGHALGGVFALSTQGRDRVHNALQKLSWCSSMGDVLHFGFGIHHPVRILADTENGYSLLVLCGALGDLSTNYEPLAKILSELTGILGAPQRLHPSLRQWRALIKTCGGIFSTTPFSIIYAQFLRLVGTDSAKAKVGSPQDIAQALNAISKLSRKELQSICLTGNPTCCWIAAFGYWFFGLELEIRNADGTVVFRSIGNKSSVHIIVLSGPPEVGKDIELANTTYVIQDIDELLLETFPLSTGRVEWNKVLADGYGVSGQVLIEGKVSFGKLICSAARIFEAVRYPDPKLLEFCLDAIKNTPDKGSPSITGLFRNWTRYNEQSFGRGFLGFSQSCLPEIGDLEVHIGGYAKISLSKAISDYSIELANLERLCQNGLCAGNESDFCVSLLAESIILMLWKLSNIAFDPELCPTRLGLVEVYKIYRKYGERASRNRIVTMIMKTFTSIISIDQFIEILFTGSDNHNQPFPISGCSLQPAFYSCGICFFVDTLKGIPDRPDIRPYLHVMPGTITLTSGRHYSCVFENHDPTSDFEARNYQELSDFTLLKDTGSPQLMAELLVTESIDNLTLSFRFKSSSGQVTRIGPMSLLNALLSAYGRVPGCPDFKGQSCQVVLPPDKSLYSVEGEGDISPTQDVAAGRRVVIRQLWGNTIARAVALLTAQEKGSSRVGYILRVDECLSCCIHAALGSEYELVYIIS